MSSVMKKLGMVVVVSIVLVVSLMLLKTWYENTNNYASDEVCRQSIASYSRLVEYGLPADTSSIHCKPDKITLSENKDVKRILAEDMRRCWKNYGQGKLKLFGEGDGIFCSVCSFINSEDDLSVENFNKYLFLTPMIHSDDAYASYLSGYKTSGFDRISKSELYKKMDNSVKDSFTIKKSDNFDYATVFVYIKGENYLEKWIKRSEVGAKGGAIMAGGGAIMIMTGVGLQTIPLIGTLTGGILIVGGLSYILVTEHLLSSDFEYMSNVVIVPYTSDSLYQLGCTKIPVSMIDE